MTLTDHQKKLLSIIQQRGVIRGFELRRLGQFSTAQQLVETIEPLVSQHFITVSGDMSECEVDRAHFAPLSEGFKVRA